MTPSLTEVKAWLKVFDELTQAEEIPDATRRRVLNRFLFGHPDGDVFAKASLAVESAVAPMAPATLLGFRKGEWITSAEEAGWETVPETVTICLPNAGAKFTPCEDDPEEADRG